jgi:hypothetical protein
MKSTHPASFAIIATPSGRTAMRRTDPRLRKCRVPSIDSTARRPEPYPASDGSPQGCTVCHNDTVISWNGGAPRPVGS